MQFLCGEIDLRVVKSLSNWTETPPIRDILRRQISICVSSFDLCLIAAVPPPPSAILKFGFNFGDWNRNLLFFSLGRDLEWKWRCGRHRNGVRFCLCVTLTDFLSLWSHVRSIWISRKPLRFPFSFSQWGMRDDNEDDPAPHPSSLLWSGSVQNQRIFHIQSCQSFILINFRPLAALSLL